MKEREMERPFAESVRKAGFEFAICMLAAATGAQRRESLYGFGGRSIMALNG
jgi:hypothetical protein